MSSFSLLTAAVLLVGLGKPDADLLVPAIDRAGMLSADRQRAMSGQPLRYAVPFHPDELKSASSYRDEGRWRQRPDGSWEWTLTVATENATSIDFGFDDFWLPNGAELWIEGPHGEVLGGPFSDRNNRTSREFWTPVVPGPEVQLRLEVPAAVKDFVRLRLNRVNAGYRLFNPLLAKSQSCNVDVVCPEGDDFRDQIRSVAAITEGDNFVLCSGQLVNKTGSLDRAYFLTANHCGISATDAASLVLYFNYQSPTCRSGSDSADPLPLSIGDPVFGATLIANSGPRADFRLLELDDLPPADLNVFYAGWDRRDIPPERAAIVHHPNGDEKRIAVEFDPVVEGDDRFDIGNVDLAAGDWWEVREWDVGITEGGSSGGGLFDQNGRVVGQLAGGFAFSCPGAEEGFDAFGKLAVSWDGEGTPQTRLSDWLDPTDSGAEFIDGSNGCDQPAVEIDGPSGAVRVGNRVVFTASASGGEPPYSYDWDLDGDGETDSTLPVFEARFKRGGANDVTLTVTDAAGCPVTSRFGLPVLAPSLEVTATEDPVEVCGDGDALLEQGEVWRFPLEITNLGDVEAVDALAAFAVSGAPPRARRLAGPDDFGYTARDTAEGFCAYHDFDISGSGTQLEIAGDDDAGALVSLGGGAGFDFYGKLLTELVMSTNGYLAADPGDDGGDFGNDCPLPRSTGENNSARIMPLHDDLVVDGGLYHQHFPTCPRPAEANPGQACDVFQWERMRYFSGPADRFDFQAILYRDSFDLVFQYGPGNPGPGDGSTTAIQNAVPDIALNYACNEPDTLAPESAVCIFHPDSAAPEQSDRVELLNPAIELGTVPVGSTVAVALEARIGEDFPCGRYFRLDYLGAGYDRGFSGPGLPGVVTAIVSDEPCDSLGRCDLFAGPDIAPREGFWLNARRPGTGMDLHFRAGFYSAWYTSEPDGTPVWYYLQSLTGQTLQSGQINVDLLRFRGPVEDPPDPAYEVVGDVIFTFSDPSRALMTWTLDGISDGELIQFFDLNSDPVVDPDVTDQWFAPAEPGWGYGVHRQGTDEFSAVYFYATNDEPVWAVTLDAAALFTTGLSPLGVFDSHCPHCVWTTPVFVQNGTVKLEFDGESGETDLQIDVTAPGGATVRWQRDALPIRPIRILNQR